MPKRSSKLPDPSELARHVLDTVVPDAEQPKVEEPAPAKNPAAVALGKLGGKVGGPARAAKLTANRRSEIAKKAAKTRWNRPKE